MPAEGRLWPSVDHGDVHDDNEDVDAQTHPSQNLNNMPFNDSFYL